MVEPDGQTVVSSVSISALPPWSPVNRLAARAMAAFILKQAAEAGTSSSNYKFNQ